jgi:hypothetical protein
MTATPRSKEDGGLEVVDSPTQSGATLIEVDPEARLSSGPHKAGFRGNRRGFSRIHNNIKPLRSDEMPSIS